MSKYKPNCVKCKEKYDSDEPDDYYCPKCNEERLVIAKEVDKKMAMIPRKESKSDWRTLDETGELIIDGARITCSKIIYKD